MKNKTIYQMTISAMLIAVAILIPMYSPIKVIIEPASFTLGSHVAIMIAMFVSPYVAVAVELGATLGFFLAGFSYLVVLRALSQVVFVMIGAYLLKKKPEIMKSTASIIGFMALIGVIHAVCEVLIVLPFYWGSDANTWITVIFGLVGIGTFIHSCIDFIIAMLIWKPLVKNSSIAAASNVKAIQFSKKA